MVTLGSGLDISLSPGLLAFWPVEPNLSTRGQARLVALRLHKEVVTTEKGEKKGETKYEQYKTAQKSGGRHPPTLKLCFFQEQHNRGDCSFGIRRISALSF